MKSIIVYTLLAIGITSSGMEWKNRSFDIIDPDSLWDSSRYSQEDADNHENNTDDQPGTVWQTDYNSNYELGTSTSIVLTVDLWAKNGWYSLVWIDDSTGEMYRLANSKGAEGEGYFRLTITMDGNHHLADDIQAGQGTVTTLQMVNREKPKPEFGTWYAGQYYVDIMEWSVDESEIDPLPPYIPEAGFPTKSTVSIDPDTGAMTFSFELLNSHGETTIGEGNGYSVHATTNLVTSEWFKIADGFFATVEPAEEQMFMRLVYEE